MLIQEQYIWFGQRHFNAVTFHNHSLLYMELNPITLTPKMQNLTFKLKKKI